MENRLIWIDVETTGLYPSKHQLLEVAVVITDSQLNEVVEPQVVTIIAEDEVLDNLDERVRKMHAESGLLERVRQSTTSLAEAEEIILKYLQEHTIARKSALCGNNVSFDRNFLERHMFKVARHLYFRNIDVSAIQQLVNKWGLLPEPFQKEYNHTALSDIRESIAELKFYKDTIFNKDIKLKLVTKREVLSAKRKGKPFARRRTRK